jgi:hypothetical protein
MRVTFQSQHKIRSTFIARSAAVGATVGVTPALIVLLMESEVNKMEYAIAFAVVAINDAVCVRYRTLPSRGVNAIPAVLVSPQIGVCDWPGSLGHPFQASDFHHVALS